MWPNLKKHPYLSATILGGLFALGYAPFHLWWISILSLALLIALSQAEDSIKKVAIGAFLFGFTFYIATIHWIARSFYVDFGSWWTALPLGTLAVTTISAYLALYITLTFITYKKLPSRYQNPASFALIWLFFEYVRSQLPSVFPWNLLGYIWGDHIEFMQLAAFGEVWIMSFIACLSAAMIAWRLPKNIYLPPILSIILLSTCWGIGHYRLSQAETKNLDLNIHLIQANISQLEKWDRSKRREHLKRYVNMSQSTESPDLVIWPEMAILSDITKRPTFREQLLDRIESNYFMTGGVRLERNDHTNYTAYNAAFLLDKEGVLLHEYHKQELLPYGEYIPFRKHLPKFIQKVIDNRLDYSSGLPDRLVSLPNGKHAIILICGESAIPSLAEQNYLEADFIINLTNDSWFDFTIGPIQHFEMSRIRAVSANLPVLRIANTGITAAIDRYGRILKRLEMNQQGVLKLYSKDKL